VNEVVFFGGTAAELIKLFPVLLRAEEAKASWCMLFSGQSPQGFRGQWNDFGFPVERLHALIDTKADLHRAQDAALWFARAMAVPKRRIRQLVGDLRPGTPWIVHGDTLSTLVGAVHGRRMRATVGHVEAGLRSGRYREPFPEEISRSMVGQIAKLHFPPEPSGEANLRREHARGRIVQTQGNTQLDAISAALTRPPPVDIPTGHYGLVNIHRYETLLSSERKSQVKRVLLDASAKHKLVLVAHETTQAWLDVEHDFRRDLEKNGATLLSRQPFLRFAHWLNKARFVIADSGGNQQECGYLGVPCLLLRVVTETAIDPARKCVVLSRFDRTAIDSFLANPDAYRESPLQLDDPPASAIWREITALRR
jgi:UDP-N-acetylglucosamine 2-epimerase (non-hydrolysing)